MQRFLNNWSVLCTAIEVHFGKGTKGDTALPTLPNPHYPSKIANTLALLCTITLASLVKGEVLSPEKIRATTGGIAFLPHPFCFSDTSVNNPSIVGSASHCNRSSPLHKGAKGDSALPTLPKPHYPSKIANTLASLVKGRWIDGKAQTVALLCLNCDTPALFITKPFCRQDGGIAAPTFAPHYPTRFSCCEFDSLTSHKNKIRPRFHGGELISISLSGVWGVAPMWVVGRWCRCVCALTAICAVASCNGFVWLSLCVLA